LEGGGAAKRVAGLTESRRLSARGAAKPQNQKSTVDKNKNGGGESTPPPFYGQLGYRDLVTSVSVVIASLERLSEVSLVQPSITHSRVVILRRLLISTLVTEFKSAIVITIVATSLHSFVVACVQSSLS